jgi:hypothetical protein
MTSTMSRNPTPLDGVAKRERAHAGGGAWFFDVIDSIDQKRGDCPRVLEHRQ